MAALAHAVQVEKSNGISIEADIFSSSRLMIGASTVCAENQLREIKLLGGQFASTMYYARSLAKVAREVRLPLLHGVLTMSEAREALLDAYQSADGSNNGIECALKFFPASQLKSEKLGEMLAQIKLREHHLLAQTSIFVAGGVELKDLLGYIEAGAHGFAVGIDCKRLSKEQITKKLEDYIGVCEQASTFSSNKEVGVS